MELKKVLSFVFMVLLSCMLSACNGGGDGSSSSDSSADGSASTLSGVASKGLINGGTVNVYSITSDGQKGSLLATTTTDSDGNYSISIDSDEAVIIEVSGGTYTDEATGEEVELTEALRAVASSISEDVTIAVTPLTELAVRVAESSGNMSDENIESANEYVSQLVGVDIIATLPTDPNDSGTFGSASEEAQNYALFLAAMSQMAETSADQDISDIIDAFEEDLSDSSLDDVADDLTTAVSDFLESAENSTGADDASGLVETIEDVVENGFDSTYAISGYLQYRTYADSDNNGYRYNFGLSKNGLPVDEDDIEDVTVTDEDGNEITPSSEEYYLGSYYSYDCTGESATLSSKITDSQVYGAIDTLAAGTYEIEFVMADEQTVSKSISFPGQLALPVIDSSTMEGTWSDGALVLSWTNPTEEENWSEVDQLRIILMDGEKEDLLYVKLNATEQTITIPASVIQEITSLQGTSPALWQIQARAYNENNMNYARSISSKASVSYSIVYRHLQYRTYESASPSNPYRLWLEVCADGEAASDGDFSNVKIYDSEGNEVTPAQTPEFETEEYENVIYDCRNGSESWWKTSGTESGFYTGLADLPSDTYTLSVDTADGSTLSTLVQFPGAVTLPVIPSSSFWFSDDDEGENEGLMGWTNPTDEENWSKVDQIRLIFSDADGKVILVVKADPELETVNIPGDAIDVAEALASGDDDWTVTIQTRAYDENGMNYARGISSKILSDDSSDFSIDSVYLQYRTYQDQTTSTPYRLYMAVSVDGETASEDDFSNVKIYDSEGNEITPENTPEFSVDEGVVLVYDCTSDDCTPTVTSVESGFSAKFASLPADTYKITVDTSSGETLSTEVEFSGAVELPVIQSSSITVLDVEDGEDGEVTWTNPTSEDNWSEVDQLRLYFYDVNGNNILVVKLNPEAENVTIPSATNATTEFDASDYYPLTLVIQTRAYDDNSMNYARGYSSDVTIEE